MPNATNSKLPDLIEQLKSYSGRGVPYYQAEQELLAKGWSADDLRTATMQFTYDTGKAENKPDPLAQAEERYYTEHPADAEQVGGELLADQRTERREQATADALAADAAPDPDSKVHFQNNFLSDVDVPWWQWVLINAVVIGGVLYFHLPQYLGSLALVALIIYLIIKRA